MTRYLLRVQAVQLSMLTRSWVGIGFVFIAVSRVPVLDTPGVGSTTVFRGSLPVVSMSKYSQFRVSDPCFAMVGVLLVALLATG